MMRHYDQLLNGGTGFREERNHCSEEAVIKEKDLDRKAVVIRTSGFIF